MSKNSDNILNRRQIREKVMQAIYAQRTSESPQAEVFKQLLEDDYRKLLNKQNDEFLDSDANYMYKLYYGTLKNFADYEEYVKPNLENWDLQRVALIDRIILSMAIHEMLTFKDIPVKATINENLEIAKTFSTENSARFVNGILDAVYERLKSEKKIEKIGRGLIEEPIN